MAPHHRAQLPYRVRIKLFFRRLGYRLRTPLSIRGSLRRLRYAHKRPWLALLRLFIPFPSWHFPLPEPTDPKESLGNVSLMFHRRYDLINLQSIPIWRYRDTPLRSLYRLYESMASGEYAPMGQETEYFWYQRKWELNEIEDPRDPDLVRYAILACLVEELVTAFNWRLSLGMRRDHNHILRERDADPYPPYEPVSGPSWTRHVPPIGRDDVAELPREFVNDDYQLVLEEKGVNKVFAKRNIVTNVGWLYTI